MIETFNSLALSSLKETHGVLGRYTTWVEILVLHIPLMAWYRVLCTAERLSLTVLVVVLLLDWS